MLRAARSLAFALEGSDLWCSNYLLKTTFECHHELVDLLAQLEQWTAEVEVKNALSKDANEAEELVDALLACGALLRQGTPAAREDTSFQESWSWGTPAALMHFSVQDNPLMPVEVAEAGQVEKQKHKAQPTLAELNGHGPGVIDLPCANNNNDLLRTMAKRRTQRDVQRTSIGLEQLSECLFAGVGITGATENKAGKLPLKMTPSGGARNPYEAYVLIQRVTGLDAGIYHYSATEHSLKLLRNDIPSNPSSLLGDQMWLDDMACLVFLCAHFERTMWKYEDPNSYRVVLIEAGHIGQNIMLAATHHGLTACPSAALHHKEISKLCGLDHPILTAPIYALGIGRPIALQTGTDG